MREEGKGNIGKWMLAIVATFASSIAGAVTVCYEGRLLSEYGVVQSSQSKTAVVRAYDGETDGAKLLGSAQTTIKTDVNGLFAATAELDIPSSNSVFWVGVEVDGTDIKPRMRVNPAPFALVAAEAERIESDGTVKLSGNVAVGSISNGTVAVNAKTVALNGDTVVRGSVENAGDVYIGAIDAAKGNVGMMRVSNPNNITTQWDGFQADKSVSVSVRNVLYMTETGELALTAEDDGIAMVMVRASVGDSDACHVDLKIDNGDITIYNMGPSDSTDTVSYFAAGTDSAGKTVTRLFTFPVRRGKSVTVAIKCEKNFLSGAAAVCDVKARMVYFGAGK